jgi:hypothetical protein
VADRVVHLTEAEKRSRARKNVARWAANSAEGRLREVWSADDLAWAFKGHEQELEELELLAERTRAELRERRVRVFNAL